MASEAHGPEDEMSCGLFSQSLKYNCPTGISVASSFGTFFQRVLGISGGTTVLPAGTPGSNETIYK